MFGTTNRILLQPPRRHQSKGYCEKSGSRPGAAWLCGKALLRRLVPAVDGPLLRAISCSGARASLAWEASALGRSGTACTRPRSRGALLVPVPRRCCGGQPAHLRARVPRPGDLPSDCHALDLVRHAGPGPPSSQATGSRVGDASFGVGRPALREQPAWVRIPRSVRSRRRAPGARRGWGALGAGGPRGGRAAPLDAGGLAGKALADGAAALQVPRPHPLHPSPLHAECARWTRRRRFGLVIGRGRHSARGDQLWQGVSERLDLCAGAFLGARSGTSGLRAHWWALPDRSAGAAHVAALPAAARAAAAGLPDNGSRRRAAAAPELRSGGGRSRRVRPGP
mmetsp:Transcript_67415/g.213322  ORF Transcript_67415/g.213322 Transcript_67415/m.213322 type:complete len:339 (-) Transcript_67415:259-1275(-)